MVAAVAAKSKQKIHPPESGFIIGQLEIFFLCVMGKFTDLWWYNKNNTHTHIQWMTRQLETINEYNSMNCLRVSLNAYCSGFQLSWCWWWFCFFLILFNSLLYLHLIKRHKINKHSIIACHCYYCFLVSVSIQSFLIQWFLTISFMIKKKKFPASTTISNEILILGSEKINMVDGQWSSTNTKFVR